jgi:hypothetical protein
MAMGVEVLAYGCELSVAEIKLTKPLSWFASLSDAQQAR